MSEAPRRSVEGRSFKPDLEWRPFGDAQRLDWLLSDKVYNGQVGPSERPGFGKIKNLV